MATLTLIVRPDGRAILTCPQKLDERARHELIGQLHSWEEGIWPIAVVDDCEVVQIGSFELALGEPAAVSA